MIFKENSFSVRGRLGRTVTNTTWILVCVGVPVSFSLNDPLFSLLFFLLTIAFQSLGYFVIIPKIIKKNFKDSV